MLFGESPSTTRSLWRSDIARQDSRPVRAIVHQCAVSGGCRLSGLIKDGTSSAGTTTTTTALPNRKGGVLTQFLRASGRCWAHAFPASYSFAASRAGGAAAWHIGRVPQAGSLIAGDRRRREWWGDVQWRITQWGTSSASRKRSASFPASTARVVSIPA